MSSQLQSDRPTAEPRTTDMKNDHGEGPKKPREARAKRLKGDELIARNLKMVYDEIAGEPLPDDLAALLAKLDASEEKSS